MDWIFDNFQILALVGLALASWLKHRSDTKAAEREEREAREEMSELPDWFENEEEWQAPQPERQMPPPPPLFRTAPPPVPQVVVQGDAELQRQQDLQERLRQVRETRESSARQAKQAKEARQARQAKQARQARSAEVKTSAATAGKLRTLLRGDRRAVRRAILLREILGPPVSQRRNPSGSTLEGA